MEEAVDQVIKCCPPEATRRKSVQIKLCFGIPKSNGENAKEKAAERPKKRKARCNSKAEASKSSKDDAVPLAKRQRRGVKEVPSRKRCKALESKSGKDSQLQKEVNIYRCHKEGAEGAEGPSLDNHKEVTIDLRSEAKRDAEENSKLLAGKQMHPFFANRTQNKIAAESTPDYLKPKDKSSISCCPPIHVHDSPPKYDDLLNWGRWTFKEAPSLDKSHLPLETSCSFFEGTVKPLTLESGLSKETRLAQFSVDAIATPNIQLSSELAPICSFKGDSDSSLWTDKYRPENASQVCGNSVSVRYLSEWLKGWNERGHKSIKNFKATVEISEDSCSSWLNNSLLITGPVGSGKSAAVYACAKELGFNIVEVNSSDLRNGVHIRKKFGEATESHGLGKWNNGTVKQVAVNKTLVLFEDVDTVFKEDRGFICTIHQLADSTKWPIVLTSNKKKPVLPRRLSRLVLEFNRPSSDELLLHVQKVCALEKAEIPVPLLKHAIDYCFSDIRRTIMLLQFWCQKDSSSRPIRSVENTWNSLRNMDEELKDCMTSDSKMADLNSEMDLLVTGCSPLIYDMLDQSLALSDEPDNFSRLLTSSFSSEEILHGDLAPNKLRSSLAHTSRSNRQQQQESSLYNAVLPIVPRNLSLSLRGSSFHEYISSTSQISKLEFSRLSQNELWGSSRTRRSRQSRHYLTIGKLKLSPEEAELLARCNSYDGNISQ